LLVYDYQIAKFWLNWVGSWILLCIESSAWYVICGYLYACICLLSAYNMLSALILKDIRVVLD
jgi:hypothetical protein